MLDTNGALDYLRKLHDNAQPVSTESDVTQESTEASQTTEIQGNTEQSDATGNAEPGRSPDENSNPGADTVSETVDAKEDGTSLYKNAEKPKRKYSKQERLDYAFAAEKRKRKDLQEKYDKQIAELEARLKRYEGLSEEDYGSDKAGYINHLLDQRSERDRLAKIRQDKADAEYQANLEEAMEKHAVRMEECFHDQDEKDRYLALLQNGAAKFKACLDEHDADGVVNAYLSDSEVQPLLTRLLMTNPNALRKVLNHKNPTLKMFELRSLENQLQMQRRVSDKLRAKPKTVLPVLGSQVKNMGAGGNGKRDWNAYLQEFPNA